MNSTSSRSFSSASSGSSGPPSSRSSGPPSSGVSSSSGVTSSTSYTAAADAYTRAQRGRSLPPVASIKQFPKIHLTTEEQVHYDRVVGRLLYRTVQEYAKYNGEVNKELWTPVRSKNGTSIYRSVKGTDDPRVSLLIGVGKIDGSLEDVMDGMYSETTNEYMCMKAFLKSKAIAGRVLHVSEKRTPDDPFTFAGIKWVAVKTPGGSLSSDRDMLTYERQGTTFDADGNEIAYHLLQSIDRPEWPANMFKNVIRSHASICYLYKRTGNRVETFFLGEFYASGSFPQRISDYAIARVWLTVVNSIKTSEAKKLSQLKESINSSRTSESSIMLSDINICHVCEERRGAFSVQTLCTGCQQNVCKSCSEEKKLFELDNARRPLIDRFCKECLVSVAKQRGSRILWDGVGAEQPPAYFDHMFQLAGSKSVSTFLSEDSCVDVSYLDRALARNLNLDSTTSSIHSYSSYGDYSVDGGDDLIRRRRSHEARLSSSSYTREQLMEDLFAKK